MMLHWTLETSCDPQVDPHKLSHQERSWQYCQVNWNIFHRPSSQLGSPWWFIANLFHELFINISNIHLQSIKSSLLLTNLIRPKCLKRCPCLSWWRHQMETFSVLLAICAGNSPVTGEFPSQRPVTQSFDVFFDLRLNELLRKQSWGW